MCELSVYTVAGGKREMVMEGVVRMVPRDGKVILEGILGESKEVPGILSEVNIIAQEANIESK
jgi:predicted RNA-binding protein